MKSVAQQLSEVADSLNKAGHTQLVAETLRQDAGKQLEGKLTKLTEFAESVGASPKAVAANEALVEAAMNTFGMTKEEAEAFASPNRPSSDPKWDNLIAEAK